MRYFGRFLTAAILVIALQPAFFADFSCAGSPVIETTAKDRRDISLSIYTRNLCLVRESREVDFHPGDSELRFRDIPSQVRPSSIWVHSPDGLGSVKFLEQAYVYEPITPKGLLDAYVGRAVRLVETDKETGVNKSVDAVLISNTQGPIYSIDGEIHIGHPGRVVLPSIPDGMTQEPAIRWRVNSSGGGKHPLEVSYLTEGINWSADYSIVLNAEDTRADLSCLVLINNGTDEDFQGAGIKLIAGDVGGSVKEPQMMRMKAVDDLGSGAAGIAEEEVFEYHLYILPEKNGIDANRSKQLTLIEAERVPIKKEFRYYGGEQYYYRRYTDLSTPQKIGVYLELENKKTYHLGMPMPEGTVRVYKRDSEGDIQFVGEDRISHTPEEEKFKVNVGYAFDLVAERRQVDWRKPSSDVIEVSWEITLRNHKDSAAWIKVVESVPGDWEVMSSSHNWSKEDARHLNFEISVAPKGEEKIGYRVRIRQ